MTPRISFIKEEKNKIRRKLIERLRLINELIPKNDLSSGKIERIYIFFKARWMRFKRKDLHAWESY